MSLFRIIKGFYSMISDILTDTFSFKSYDEREKHTEQSGAEAYINISNTYNEMIFFLNQEEYDMAMKSFNKSKELYEKQLKAAELIKKMPMSHLYHNILKMGK